MILGGELKMATYRVDKRREEAADHTDKKLKELQAHFAGEVEELKKEFIGKLQVLEQRKCPKTNWIILVTMLVVLALCLGVAATIAFNAVTAQNELRREFELLSTNLEIEKKKLREEIHLLKTKQGEQELRKKTEEKELKEEIHLLKTKQEKQELRKKTEENELKEEIHSLKTKQEQQEDQTEGTNVQVGYLMGQLNSLLTVKEGAAALLAFTAVIAIGVVFLCLFCQNNLVVSMPLRNSRTMLRMIEQ